VLDGPSEVDMLKKGGKRKGSHREDPMRLPHKHARGFEIGSSEQTLFSRGGGRGGPSVPL